MVRQRETLRLYKPTPIQERYHSARCKEVLFRAGNQVGKTLAGAVEVARAVTGQDPHNKYPKKDGIAVCVGFKEKDIGVNIYPYLFEPGCGGRLYVLKNRKTDAWELYEPWNLDHVLQKEQRELAGPLIPPRFIRKFAWHKSGKRVFYSVDFITGWKLYAFSSTAEPTAGFQANLVHIDEDLSRDDWYSEMVARLTMRAGLMRWTALPLSKNDAMMLLQDRAEAESLKPNPETIVITATVFDNPYMDQETREQNIRIWKSEGDDVYRQRALGEETVESILMYPSFSRITHSAWRDDFREGEHLALDILRENQGIPPRDWMRSMVVDPGHTVCAILYIATAPPSLGSLRIVYDEDYIQQATAPIFGERAAAKVKDWCFQRFIMDMHGGRLRSLDTGLSPAEAYSRELEIRGVRCVETASRFRAGSDNVRGREESLRQWLAIRPTGLPTALIVVQRCPNLVREIARFRKKVIDGVTQDEGNRRANTHAVECLEYAAADGLSYISPHVEGMERSAAAMKLHRGIQHRLRKSQMKKTGAMAATGFSFSRGEG